MNMVLNPAAAPTMSSREIAELVEKRHDNVKRTIETLAERGVIGVPQIEEYRDSLNRAASEYRIGKRDSYIIVAQLSPEFTARLVDRWQELEAQAGPKVPTTLAGALRLAAEQAEAIELQQQIIEEQRPAVEFVDRYATARGSKGFREVCKLLRANEREFGAWLIERDIMYRLGGKLTPYQNHIDAGRFEIKAGVSAVNEHAFNQARFTPKGVTWIAGEWGKRLVEAA